MKKNKDNQDGFLTRLRKDFFPTENELKAKAEADRQAVIKEGHNLLDEKYFYYTGKYADIFTFFEGAYTQLSSLKSIIELGVEIEDNDGMKKKNDSYRESVNLLIHFITNEKETKGHLSHLRFEVNHVANAAENLYLAGREDILTLMKELEEKCQRMLNGGRNKLNEIIEKYQLDEEDTTGIGRNYIEEEINSQTIGKYYISMWDNWSSKWTFRKK